jgi:predicted amidohydrolase
MTAVTIAAVNMTVTNNKAENLTRVVSYIEEAAAKGAGLIVFPEACIQGYIDRSPTLGSPEQAEMKRALIESAEAIPGPATETLARACARTGMVAQVGMIEHDPNTDSLYNSVAVIGPTGLLGRYRKTHNQYEFPYFRSGNCLCVIETPVGRLGPVICSDMDFPEVFRTLTTRGAELITGSAAWPMKAASREFDYYGWCLEVAAASGALFNQVWCIVSNQCTAGAYEGKINYYGHSRIVAPDGLVLAEAGWEEGLVLATANMRQQILEARTERYFGLNLLESTRPELYAAFEDQNLQ